MIARIMSSLYPDNMVAVHFNMFRTVDPDNVSEHSFSSLERFVRARLVEFESKGFGYHLLQTTKVCLSPREMTTIITSAEHTLYTL